MARSKKKKQIISQRAKQIAVRALHTFCQTMLGMLGTEGLGLFQVDWKTVLSVCSMSALISILKSIAVGIPEGESNGNN